MMYFELVPILRMYAYLAHLNMLADASSINNMRDEPLE